MHIQNVKERIRVLKITRSKKLLTCKKQQQQQKQSKKTKKYGQQINEISARRNETCREQTQDIQNYMQIYIKWKISEEDQTNKVNKQESRAHKS